jgi:hypothetical protein
MQKFFLISFILAAIYIPIRRAQRERAYPLSQVITDFVLFSVCFGLALRFVFGRLPT